LSEPPRNVHFSPDGRRLAVPAGNRVLLFDTAADHPPAELAHPKDVQFARFAGTASASVLVTAADSQVYLWDPAARSLIRPPLQHDATVAAAAVSPDGRYVAAVDTNGVLMGWQIAGGRLDADATARLVRLVSGRAVEGDEVVSAGADQLEDDWGALRRTHPGELRPATDLAAHWHIGQFNALVSTRRFGPAGRHLEASWPISPGNDWSLLMTGACYLAAGDRDGVRRAFLEMARIAGGDPNPMYLTRAVETGLLDPEALPPAGGVYRQKRSPGSGPPGSKRDGYFVLARALALTRAGRLDEAEQELARVRAAGSGIVKARADAQLAVVRRLQGRADEGKKLADAAAVELARHESGGLTGEWISAIFLRRLVDEARRPLPKPASDRGQP
jgi:hypothetical protein